MHFIFLCLSERTSIPSYRYFSSVAPEIGAEGPAFRRASRTNNREYTGAADAETVTDAASVDDLPEEIISDRCTFDDFSDESRTGVNDDRRVPDTESDCVPDVRDDPACARTDPGTPD